MFGRKPDSGALTINFDKVYGRVIKPAIERCGMEPIRADEELAVLEGDERDAKEALVKALGEIREKWEAETTVNNLRLIRECRERRGPVASWQREIEEALEETGSRH